MANMTFQKDFFFENIEIQNNLLKLALKKKRAKQGILSRALKRNILPCIEKKHIAKKNATGSSVGKEGKKEGVAIAC